MKKNLLLGTLMLMGVYSTIQSQNVIVNGDFEDVTVTAFPEITHVNQAGIGVWNSFDKNETRVLTVSLVDDDISHGKVAKLITTKSEYWYTRYFMQKITMEIEPKVYKLSVDIKSESATKPTLSAQIYIGNDNYVLINDFKPASTGASPSRKDLKTTESWQTLTCEFDFSRMSNNINSISSAAVAIGPSTKNLLSNCILAIYAAVDKNNDTELLIDNVKLEPVTDKAPSIIHRLTLYDLEDIKIRWKDGSFAALQSYANNPELVAIDMSTVKMPTLTENNKKNILTPANPNCLIYIKEKAIPHTSWKNVVTGNKATEINLVDNDGNNTYYPFENSVVFTADKITYRRNYPRAGSSSICLPFAVTNLPDGIGIEKFAGSTGTTVNFEDAGTTLDANTPYLIKINTIGDKVFEGTNATIGITRETSTEQNPDNGNYLFKGTLENIPDATGLYILDPQGTGFAKGTNQNFIPAFRAYMTTASTPSGAPKLSIARDGGATSINSVHNPICIQPVNNGVEITTAEAQNIRIHTFDGRLIKDITVGEGTYTVTGLAKGIYLVNGQKVVVE